MLCIIFGVMIASLFWAWLGAWAIAPGVIAAVGLFLTMRYWPLSPQKK